MYIVIHATKNFDINISVVLKGSQVSPKITCSYILSGCYAKCTLCKSCAWNNSYTGQEEAIPCIVKYLKEDKSW